MKLLIRMVDRLSGWCGGLAAALLCGGLLLSCAEILLRSVWSKTLFITDEYSGYLVCGIAFCGLSYTLRERGHIRMTLLRQAIRGRGRQYLDICCSAVGALFTGLLAVYLLLLFWDSLQTGSRSMQISETYLAIPQFFMPFGAIVLGLQFLADFLRELLILRGDTDGLAMYQEQSDLGR